MKKLARDLVSQASLFFYQTLKINEKTAHYYLIGLIALLLFSGGFYLFLELTEFIKMEGPNPYDQEVSSFVQSFRNNDLTQYFTVVTDMGDVWGYVVAVLVATIISYSLTKRWNIALQIAAMLVVAIGSNLALKSFINRARPTAEHLVEIKTLSFPSGHAMTSMAFYGFVIYLIASSGAAKWLKTLLISIFSFFILNIGVSRIYLGVHYPTDIAGGYIAGLIWVVFFVFVLNVWKIYKQDPAAH